MQDLIQFTDRERFILSYYRDPRLSSWRRYASFHGSLLLISALFLVLAFIQHDRVWAIVAYTLLFVRACVSIWRAREYIATFRSIIAKYDAKLKELVTSGP
ncbi:MAG TPA: hypothetical protein VGM62_08960 [Chthoniobacterales bacterium]|jgi:hypothetical protein